MKAFFIPYAYPNEYNPTLCIYLKEQAMNLQNRGIDVVILHDRVLPTRYLFKRSNRSIVEYEDAPRLYRLMCDSKSFARIREFEFYAYKKGLVRLYSAAVKKYGTPDIILANFSLFSGCIAVDIAKENGIPCMVIEHFGHLLGNRVSKFEISCLRHTLDNADKFVCVSEALKDSVLRLCRKSMTHKEINVIPNSIAPEYVYYPRIIKSKFVFVSVGNLYKGKRFCLLIEAFNKAFQNSEEVELRIIGDGDQYSKIHDLIINYKLEGRVSLLGRQSKDFILKEYINSDCFVLPSEHETFGIVYREAMAVGRPIITTNHQGFQNEWSDNWGIRIDIDNEEQLIKALRDMYSGKRVYDYKLISKDCLERFSSESITNKIYACMDDCIRGEL